MAGSIIRSSTDIIRVGRALSPIQIWKRERAKMKTLGICLCVAFTVWMVSCGLLALYSHEIAAFIVRHSA